MTTNDANAAPPNPAKISYFLRHWRGELSLTKSFWVNLIGIYTVLINTLALSVIFSTYLVVLLIFFWLAWWIDLVPPNYRADAILFCCASAAILTVLTNAAFCLWAIVGTWRRALMMIKTDRKYVGPVLAMLVCVFVGSLVPWGILDGIQSFPTMSQEIKERVEKTINGFDGFSKSLDDLKR